MLKRILIGAGVVAVLATVTVVSLKTGDRKKPLRVYLEETARRDVTRVVRARGEIDPRVKVNISAHVVGKIEKLYVEEGDAVRAKEPFLELEKEAFVAARDQAAAAVAIARSRLRQSQIELQDADIKLARMRRLTEELIASAEQLESAQLQRTSAELRLEQAREAVLQAMASLEKAEDDLSKTTIYAPISGRVIELSAEEGEVVVSGTMNNAASVIGVIADLSEILAEVDVDETEVAFLEPGQSATLEVDALPERSYRGRVVEIGSSGFQRPQQPDVTFFKVKLLLEDPGPLLRPGMSVRAEVKTAENRDVVVVPIQAVVERPPLGDEEDGESPEASPPDEEIKVVFVADGKVARQRAVATGLSDATHVEIATGLEAGEKVVTGPYRSLKKLEDGDPIRQSRAGDADEEDDEA